MSRNKKAEKCAEWLSYCLSIGWPKSSLDKLQELWMKYHDDNGNFTSVEQPSDSQHS